MHIIYDDTFLSDVTRELAESQGQLGVYLELIQTREDDGLTLPDALLDASEQLGYIRELNALFETVLSPLLVALEAPVHAVRIEAERALMPTLSAIDGNMTFRLAPASLEELSSVVHQLVERLANNSDLRTVTIAAGLGGTGGCAAGECLPEDAAAGPLFEH